MKRNCLKTASFTFTSCGRFTGYGFFGMGEWNNGMR